MKELIDQLDIKIGVLFQYYKVDIEIREDIESKLNKIYDSIEAKDSVHPQIAKAAEILMEEGISYRQIAYLLGISYSDVCTINTGAE